MKKAIYTIIFTLFILNVKAQNAHFVSNGIIEFEKRSNMYAIIKNKIGKNPSDFTNKMFEAYQKNNPQFKSTKSVLNFNKTKSLFTWPKSDEPVSNNWLANDPFVELKNIIATNFDNQISISQKNIYEANYLVKDSVRKINWKITNETREIAGYECRRANALIMDSVYVVAFYTNDIDVSGGPEGFTGLPGMILGVALPHLHITWFATKVTEVTLPDKDLANPTKGMPVNNKELEVKLLGSMKRLGVTEKKHLKPYLF
jgi:GLPGLI family protein